MSLFALIGDIPSQCLHYNLNSSQSLHYNLNSSQSLHYTLYSSHGLHYNLNSVVQYDPYLASRELKYILCNSEIYFGAERFVFTSIP